MKKGILILMSVAILGAIGLAVQKKPVNGDGTTTTTISQTAQNTTSTSGSSSSSSSSSASSASSGAYKDGTYKGSAADTAYGTVQIAVVISGGKITNINFLQMPNDQGHSQEVTAYAEPLLKQNAIRAQSSKIEFVSGATSTSYGYEQSLQAALDQAAA